MKRVLVFSPILVLVICITLVGVSGISHVFASDTWTTKANMPTARNYMTSGVVNGKIYVIGGLAYGDHLLKTVEAYDPTTDKWVTKTDMPTARRGIAAGVVNDKIYVVGGLVCSNNDSTYTAKMEEYDPATDTWTTKASMPTAREHLAAGVVNGKIYVIGGSAALNTVEEYDPATNTWTAKASMPTARSDLTASVMNGEIYAIGGGCSPELFDDC